MLRASHAWSKNFHCQHPPPLNGQVPKYERWLQVTGLFHFCLDKSAVLSFFLLHFHYRSNCINMAQRSIVILFSPNASNKETIKTAEKTIKPPAIKWQKKTSTTMVGWQIFWGTGMKTMLTLESPATQCDFRFADRVVPHKIYFKKRKKWVISKRAVRNSLRHFKCHSWLQISLRSIKQVYI